MLIILGALVSLLSQFLKNKANTSEYVTLAIVIGLSFAAAIVYYVLSKNGLWESFAAILVLAGAIYTYIIQRFEKDKTVVLPPVEDSVLSAGIFDETPG